MKVIAVSALVLLVLAVTEALVPWRHQCPPCGTCPPLPKGCQRTFEPGNYCPCCFTCLLKTGAPCNATTVGCEAGLACTNQMREELDEVEGYRRFHFQGTCQTSQDRREDILEARFNPYEPLERPELIDPYEALEP